jgi:hypothetical protein
MQNGIYYHKLYLCSAVWKYQLHKCYITCPDSNMSMGTYTAAMCWIWMSILVSVDNAKGGLVSYCINILSSQDTNNLSNVTPHVQIQIGCLELILLSFI